jgi:succinyl-CoA synthetase beta subunit
MVCVHLMKLFEYEAKEILKEYDIPIPRGGLATSPTQAREVSHRLSAPFVIKAQVLVAGRGKAGGIEFAETPEDVETITTRMLNMEIKSLKVDTVWIEEKLKVKRELYFGITIDRSRRSYVAIASLAGGINIEEAATKAPAQINKMIINPALGFRIYHARQMAHKMGYSGKSMLTLSFIFRKLFQVAMEYDAELIEMNPIVETVDGQFVAADARLIIDDNALYRHPQYEERLLLENKTELTSKEIQAKKAGLAYVQLDGDIGIMGNGAGLVMATLDAVYLHKGRPANFFDVGGGASEKQIVSALDILLTDPKTSVVLINILGGITRCDYVAKGILKAKEECNFSKPMVIRLVGTNEEEGRCILAKAGIHVLDSMDEAAKRAVEISHGR